MALDGLDKEIIREMQGDLPLVAEPFREIADRLGTSESAVLDRLRALKKKGMLRRVAGILYHRNAGFQHNGMTVWKIPEEKVERAGQLMAEHRRISHVFLRSTYPDWPYNLFSMIHGETRNEVKEMAENIAARLGLSDDHYAILYSTEELKKTSMQYFQRSGEAG